MFEKYRNISGIYKITFPNNKIYIGLSTNIQQRLTTHKKTHDDLPIHKAIEKYGLKEEYITILEQNLDEEELREREKYWIAYYDSYHKGYNLTLGGDGASSGTANTSAKLTEETLGSLVQELIENKKYIKDLSKEYDLSPEAISQINCGKRYYNKDLKYPLRPDTRFTSEALSKITGVNKSSSKFNQEQLDQIIDLLKNSRLTFKEIAEQFNCKYITISSINQGKHYFNESINYPIRKEQVKPSKITPEQVLEIIELIQNTTLSFVKIGEKFNLSSSTIGRINSGKYHKQKNLTYPIRKTK